MKKAATGATALTSATGATALTSATGVIALTLATGVIALTLATGVIALTLAMSGYAVAAGDDPIEQRKGILEKFGKAAKPIGPMMKGEAKFDLATVQSALKLYSEEPKKLVELFPENSQTGHDTEASPNIWKDKAKFNGLFDKLSKDATAASKAITDEASFKANMASVFGDCKACHDDFRLKK